MHKVTCWSHKMMMEGYINNKDLPTPIVFSLKSMNRTPAIDKLVKAGLAGLRLVYTKHVLRQF